MKHLAVLCSLLFAGCVMDVEAGDEQTATEQSEIEITTLPPIVVSPTPVLSLDVNTSTTVPSSSITADAVWPLDRNISSVEIVYHQGPVRTGGPTFLAFVVWNGNHVAHIYCSYFGRAGTLLQNKLADIVATRVSFGADLGTATTGSTTGGGVVHPPRPNVFPDDEVVLDSTFLRGIKDQAVAAFNLANVRISMPGAPIYDVGP